MFPEQIHLSWTERANEMRITWVTYSLLPENAAFRSLVCNNSLASNEWVLRTAETLQFNEGRDILRTQFIHTVVLTGIFHDCLYEYTVGGGFFWSEAFTFTGRTPYYNLSNASSQDRTTPVSFILIGDWGVGRIGEYTKDLILHDLSIQPTDFIIHLGDLAYDLHERDGRNGDTFLNTIQPVAARVPYMTIPGNHEKKNNFTHYSTRFKMPVNQANEGKSWFYSFNLGSAHFVMWNSEPFYLETTEGSLQTHLNWLKNDLELANRDRKEVPWIFVCMHRALYCSVGKEECDEQAQVLRNLVEDMLYENKVDIVFQAHVHNYERDKAIYRNASVEGEFDGPNLYFMPQAPVYILNGNAGNYEGHNDVFRQDLPDFFLFGSLDYGYGRMNVINRTHAYYEEYSAESEQLIDSFLLVKEDFL
jgi:acid phosphatase type 7